MHKILIADDNKHWCKELAAAISDLPDLTVVGTAHDGQSAIDVIARLKPDLIVLDMIMPVYDGAYVVQYIKEKMDGYNPYIYVLTVLSSTVMLDIINDLDVDFYNIKPVHTQVVLRNLQNILKNGERESISQKRVPELGEVKLNPAATKKCIMETFAELGIPVHLVSTMNTCVAVLRCIDNDEKCYNINNNLYHEVAAELDTTRAAIERNIRTTIKKMVECHTRLFQQLFENSLGAKTKITNSSFLYVTATYVRMKMNGESLR